MQLYSFFSLRNASLRSARNVSQESKSRKGSKYAKKRFAKIEIRPNDEERRRDTRSTSSHIHTELARLSWRGQPPPYSEERSARTKSSLCRARASLPPRKFRKCRRMV